MPSTSHTLTWTPKAKDRPRFMTTKAGKVVAYTSKGTRDAEAAIAAQWPDPPMDGPLAVHVEMTDTTIKIDIESVPDYTNRKLRADATNYLKLIEDALNGHAWHDDRQIVRITGVRL